MEDRIAELESSLKGLRTQLADAPQGDTGGNGDAHGPDGDGHAAAPDAGNGDSAGPGERPARRGGVLRRRPRS
jgi:hypothetical protein